MDFTMIDEDLSNVCAHLPYVLEHERTEGGPEEDCNAFISEVKHLQIDVQPIGASEEHMEIIVINGTPLLFRADFNKTETEETHPKLSMRCVGNDNLIQEACDYYTQELAREAIEGAVESGLPQLKKSLNHTNRLSLALKYQDYDDYMTHASVMTKVYSLVGWKPYIDMCCGILGQNSLCPFYYDALSDATRQARSLAGHRLLCNPVYDRCEEFIATLRDAHRIDPDTKAIFVCPVRLTQPWFQELSKDPLFKVVAYYAKGADVFTAATQGNPLSTTRKNLRRGTVEPIAIWELGSEHADYPGLTLAQMHQLQEDNLCPVLAASREDKIARLEEELQRLRQREGSLNLKEYYEYEQIVQCGACPHECAKKNMKRHQQLHCKTQTCKFCEIRLSSTAAEKHAAKCTVRNPPMCETCDQQFKDTRSLNQHIKRKKH